LDSQVEQVAAALSADGLAAGRHVVYVRGQDSLGHWGPFSAGLVEIRPWQNADSPFDVDGIDGVQAADVLILVNAINLHGARLLPTPVPGSGNPPPYWDVTGDNWLTPDDVLQVINHLNAKSGLAVVAGESERYSGPKGQPTAAAVDWLMTTRAATAPQRPRMIPPGSWTKITQPSDEVPDSISARADDWMERDPLAVLPDLLAGAVLR
jgi:hypothetical protein